ncbi:energy-coupling factor transporter transmembrane component T family protein [Kineococcus sp. SYSU DK004]|uniref:energy-coupling factor transporter transmembrane component T family protein n=1 Tax=Kineococcus sp. SYSU DK004 TaxID=3383125 RepID=UPI003D7E4C6D
MSAAAPAGTVPPTAAQLRAARPGPPARRCGPLSLLAVSLLAVPGSLAVDDWRVGALALAVQLACLPLAAGRWRELWPRLVPVAVAALSVGWSAWLLGDAEDPVAAGLASVLRILVLVLPGVVLTTWLDPSEAGDHLAQRLRWPARAVVASVAALGQLTALRDTWEEVSRARRARGLGPGRGPASAVRWAASTSFGLLVDAVRRAGRTSTAMDARGFAGASRRTWALPAPWRRADTVLLVAGTAVVAVPVLLRVLTPL